MLYRLDEKRSIIAHGYKLTIVYEAESLGSITVCPYQEGTINPAQTYMTESLESGMDYELIWDCIMDTFDDEVMLIKEVEI